MLGVRRFGDGPPIVALHGFSHTGEQFREFAERLDRTTVAFDLPGHGRSAGVPTEVRSVIDAVRTSIRSLGRPVPLLGYSQGARIALATAIEDPTDIEALVLVSGTAGIEDDAERAERAEADRLLSDRIRSSGIEPFLASWTTTGITSTTHRPVVDRERDLQRRRENTADGLAGALTGYGQGAMPSQWDRLGSIQLPTLLIAGARDEPYRTIAERMADRIPGARLVVIDDAGHDPIGDDPEDTGAVVSAFLDGLG